MPRTKYPLATLQNTEVTKALARMPDDLLRKIQFSFPLFSHAKTTIKATDSDGFPTTAPLSESTFDLKKLQEQCWNKFEKNPQISSHVRDVMGRMAGWGFGFFSAVEEIQVAIDETMEDPRNALYDHFPKFCGRAEIEGELFLMLTVHDNGFVEVDFIAPTMLVGGDKGSGIIFHSMKQTLPLFYNVKFGTNSASEVLIPSINIAYFPELEEDAKKNSSYKKERLEKSRPNSGNRKLKKKVEKIGGFNRFMIRWDRGFLTHRNVSHIRTTIEWLNYYEDLKKYEIDHKKSSGAYLWVIEMEDVRAFRSWLALSEDERKTTGILQPKDPGGTLVLPPGMKLRAENPRLPSISDEDTDIMQMVSSGLNKPQDLVLGDYRSTYASVKAAQGPQNDRINDDLSYFVNFLKYGFWKPIFFLKSIVSKFKETRRIEEVVDFEGDPDSEKGLKPITKRVVKPSYKLVQIALPVSKLEDIESVAKSMLGVKHGSLVDTLNIPREEVAKRLGFYNYPSLVKQHATEQQRYPKTQAAVDQETAQEEQKKATSEQE
jgi:hypothetical protein